MNQQNAKDYLPFVQALIDGELQWFDSNGNGWKDVTEAGFSYDLHHYRRRPPAPRMVPLEAKDVPPGSVIRHATSGYKVWSAITAVKPDGIYVGHGPDMMGWMWLQSDWEISRDGGKTWAKCEKPEGT